MKTLKLITVVVLATCLTHCTSDAENDLTQEESVNIHQDISPEILLKLEKMGFDLERTSIKTHKKGYIVDGDIFISEEILQNDGVEKQAFFSIIDCNRAGNIRIQNDLGDNAAGRGFQRGIDLWNNVNESTLRLIPVNNNPDIIVRLAEPGEIQGWGLGEFPANGIEGGLIILDLNELSIDGDPVTAREWGNILAHEIGHNIGFLHSDQGNLGTQIEDTPDIDPNSIMTSGFNPEVVFNANDISINDGIALSRMYSDREDSLCGR